MKIAALAVVAVAASTAAQSTTTPQVNVRYEAPIANAHYPELVYWFTAPETLKPDRYKADIQHIVHDTPFDFAFLTERRGVTFSDNPKAHDAIKGLVENAHQNGLHVGATLQLQRVGTLRTFSLDDDQTLISEAEGMLDANGVSTLQTTAKLRSMVAKKSEILRVLVFRKTADGEYDPASLADVTERAGNIVTGPGTLSFSLQLGERYKGFTAFAMTTNWFNTLDLMSDAYVDWVHGLIGQYRDVPFDGTSLDEFGYAGLPHDTRDNFRSHFAGRSFAARFEQFAKRPLTQTIFETRYVPSGHPEIRINAIDQYWDFFRHGPLKVEQEFYSYSRQVFGDKTLAGIHDTFHDHLTNDEPWTTGLNWWTIPRQYGMSDEDIMLPVRMGLLVAHPGKIMYDQFYGHDLHKFATKAMSDARFNARLHYHGYNDLEYGVNLASDAFLAQQDPIEYKIRLLNRFDPAAPELPLLVVFGMPALLNWYPDQAARNQYDVNGSLHIEEKAKQLWDAGYRCALVPSDLIDNGSLKLDANNRPVLNGHNFRAIVYLYPQYAKPSTIAFLEQYTQHGGKLMLEGTATRDFNGQPFDSAFKAIASHATVKDFSVDRIAKLGIAPSSLRDTGGELEDGSFILTDLESLEQNRPKAFSIDRNGHRFSGKYIGVFALKTDELGNIEKLACGSCSSLSRDGVEILRLQTPADIVILKTGAGSYDAVIAGAEGSNNIQLRSAAH